MSSQHAPTHEPVTILLVDDDPDCRQLVRDALAAGHIENPILEVSSGEEALALLRRQGPFAAAPRPGLIFMDIEMPGGNGLETLRAIRRDPRWSDIAVVMLTGVTDDHQKRRALIYGANSYTHKATNGARFMQTVLEAAHYWTKIHQHPAPRACHAVA